MEELKKKLLKQLRDGEQYSGAAKKKMVKKPKKAMKGKGMIGGAMIGGAKKKANPWIVFVKKFAKENGLTYPEALRAAAPYYKK